MNTHQSKVLLVQDNGEQDDAINFKGIWLALLRRKWLMFIVFALAAIATILYTLRLKNQYEATAIIEVPLSNGNSLSGALSSLLPIGFTDSADTEIAIIKGRNLAEEVVRLLELDKENPEITWRQAVSKLRNSLEAKQKSRTNLIEITVTDESPAKATIIANKIAEEYLRLANSSTQSAWDDLINQMESELEQTKVNLDRSRQLLHQYESGKGITMAFGDLLLGQGTTRNFAMREATESVGNLRSDIMRMEVQLETMLKIFSDGDPNVISLRNQIDVSKQKLREAEQEAIGKYNKQFGLSDAAAEVAFNQQLYNILAAKHEELKAQYIIQKSIPEIVEKAIEPLKPKQQKRIILLVGLILGLFLSTGAALLSEYKDQAIHDAEGLTSFTGIHVLGNIPKIGRHFNSSRKNPGESNGDLLIDNPHLSSDDYIKRVFEDSYRLFQLEVIASVNKHLEELSDESIPQGMALLVTSSVAGEGKSIVAANLAISLASSGKKVLLVDAHVKNPIQHKLKKLDLRPGLLDYLKGDCSWQDTVKNTSNGLHIIPSGDINNLSEPSNLIMSDYLKGLVQLAKEEFDVIIFDSASTIISSESSAIGAVVDGVLLVIKASDTKRGIIQSSIKRIQGSGGYVIGTVLNGLSIEKKYRKYYQRNG